MNATNMVQGNLALKLETSAEYTFPVVQGGRSGFQPLTVKPARNQQAVAAYAESVSNVTYDTIRVQSGDSLWSLAEEYPIEGLSTQETSDMIRNVNHLEHGSLAAGAHLKVPARS